MKTHATLLTTNINQGQSDYVFADNWRKVHGVVVDGKKMDYEIILRLKEVPQNYGEMIVFVEEEVTE